MQNQLHKHQHAWEFFLLTAGTVMVSVGVYFFKFPNHFAIGGVSGLSMLLGEVVTIPWLTTATFNTIINLFFLGLGFLLLDKHFGIRTVYSTLLSSGLIQVFERIFPMEKPITDELMLELLFATFLPAFGAAIIFNLNASTGGTDIAAMILRKYTGLDVGRALLFTDILIAAAGIIIFSPTAGLCSLLGLVLKSVVVDTVIESLNRRKAFFVVTNQPDIACEFITTELHRGATRWNAQGAYTHHQNEVVLTVLSRHQAMLLRRHLNQHDPHSFMIVANSSEIFGNGFMHP